LFPREVPARGQHQGNERAGGAPQHSQGDIAGMARGVRPALARPLASNRALRRISSDPVGRAGFKDGIHRASLRADSRHLRDRAERIARELRSGNLKPPQGRARLLETRREVIAGWHAAADALLEAGQGELAQKIWRFIGGMAPPRTTDEQLAAKLEERTRTGERERQEERTR